MNKENIWPLVGNENITEFLAKHIKKNNVAGAYIFCGPEDLGKKTCVFFFAQTLLCQKRKGSEPCGTCPSCRKFANAHNREDLMSGVNSDFFVIGREEDKKNISIDQARELIKKLNMSSFLDSFKIGIIKDAHTLSLEAANALLKTLEEPKNNVVIVLLTSSLESLPATIISRSRVLRFAPVKFDTIYKYLVDDLKAPRSAAKNFAHLSGGRPALAVKFFEDQDYYESYLKKAEVFLKFFKGDLNDRFLAIEGIIGKKTKGQESVRLAEDTLSVWRALNRDLMLTEYDRNDLIWNEAVKNELAEVQARLKIKNILNIAGSIELAEMYLKANVNSKLALEQVALSI